jgi:hypothetical protein
MVALAEHVGGVQAGHPRHLPINPHLQVFSRTDAPMPSMLAFLRDYWPEISTPC